MREKTFETGFEKKGSQDQAKNTGAAPKWQGGKGGGKREAF